MYCRKKNFLSAVANCKQASLRTYHGKYVHISGKADDNFWKISSPQSPDHLCAAVEGAAGEVLPASPRRGTGL